MGDCTEGKGLPTDPIGLAGEGAISPGLGVGCCAEAGDWLPGLCGLAGVRGLLGGGCGVWNLRPLVEVREEVSESECGGMIGLGGLSSSVWDWRRWKAASSTYFMRNDFIPWAEIYR